MGRAARRHRLAVTVEVSLTQGRREAERAAVERVVYELHHGVELLGRRWALGRSLAHGNAPYGRVTDEEAGVHGQPAVDTIEVLAERVPVPSALERSDGHALDDRHHALHVVDVLGVCPAPTAARAERRDREA